MTSRLRSSVLFLSLAAACLIWAGCSGDTASSLTQSTAPQGSTAYYFPTSVGSVSTFAMTNYGGASSIMTIKMGPRIEFQGDSANMWFGFRAGQSVDTNYVVVRASGVTLYTAPQAAGETILASPLRPGQSWSRFLQVLDSVPTTDTTTLATDFPGGGIVVKGNNGGGGGGGNGGGGTGKVVPTIGSNLAYVDAVEEVALSNGSRYAGALKVRTVNTLGTQNYYWFAPGIGLVKYVLSASANHANGSEMGELVSMTK